MKKIIMAAAVAVAFGASALTPTSAGAWHHHGGWGGWGGHHHGWGGWGWGWGGWWPGYYAPYYYPYYGPYYGYGRCFRKSSGRLYCYY